MRVPQRAILRRRGARLGRQLFQGGVSAPGKDHRAPGEDVILLSISSILLIPAVLCKVAPRTRIVSHRHPANPLYDKPHALVDEGGGALAAGPAVKRAREHTLPGECAHMQEVPDGASSNSCATRTR
jgi:hypothetical protein